MLVGWGALLGSGLQKACGGYVLIGRLVPGVSFLCSERETTYSAIKFHIPDLDILSRET